MPHITWKQAAEAMVNGTDWGNSQPSLKDFIANSSTDYLQLCLLVDIAGSLRVLRCSNFKAIPNTLDRIRVAVEGIRRDRRRRAKR